MFLKAGGKSYHDVGSGIKGSLWNLRRWIQSSLMSGHWKGRRKHFPQLFFLGGGSLTGITKPLAYPQLGKQEVNQNFPGIHMEKNNGGECQGKSKELLHSVSDCAQPWQSLQRHQQSHNKVMMGSRGGKMWGIWKAQLSKATYFHQQQAWGPLFRDRMIWLNPEGSVLRSFRQIPTGRNKQTRTPGPFLMFFSLIQVH